MSDYPQVLIEYADYLQLATELSGNDPLNLVASYYCRYYWAKKAGEILKQPGNMTNQTYSYLSNQVNILNEIKQTVPGIGDSKGKELFLKFIAKDLKEIEEIDGQQQYEMECQRLMKRIKYLEAACYACPDYQKQLDGLKKKTKKRLIDVKRALQAGAPVPPMQSLNATSVYRQSAFPSQNPMQTSQFPAPNPSFPPSFPQQDAAPSFPQQNAAPSFPQQDAAPSFPPSFPSSNPSFPSSNPSFPSSNPSFPPSFPQHDASPSFPSSNPSFPPSAPSFPSAGYGMNPPSFPAPSHQDIPAPSLPSIDPPSIPDMSVPQIPPSYPLSPSPNSPAESYNVPDVQRPSFNGYGLPSMPDVTAPSLPADANKPLYDFTTSTIPMQPKVDQNFYPTPSRGDYNAPADPKMDSRMDPRMDSRMDSRMDPRMDSRMDSRMDPRMDSRMDSRMDPRMDSRMDSRMDQTAWPVQPREEPRNPSPSIMSSASVDMNVKSDWEGNTEGLLNAYNKAATETASSNKELAKAIYQAMINACSTDPRYQGYARGFEDAIRRLN